MNQHYLNPNFLKISLFFLIVIFPLSLASGSGVININTILISSIILFYISKKINFFILKDNFIVFLIIFLIFIFLNSAFHYENLELLIKSIGNFRYLLLSIGVYFFLSEISKKTLKILIFLNLILIICIGSDIIYQYIFDQNIFGFLPGMCDENQNNCTRFSGVFGSELIAGAYVSQIGLLNLFLIDKLEIKNKNINIFTKLIFGLFIFLVILITGERSALLVLILSFFFFFYFNKKIFIFLLLNIFFLSMIFILAKNSHAIKSRYLNLLDGWNSKKELTIKDKIVNSPWSYHYQAAYELFLKKPVLGHGPKSFRVKCAETNIEKKLIEKEDYYVGYRSCSTHPHNYMMEFLSEHGIVGFLFFIFFFFKSFFILYKLRNKEKNENIYFLIGIGSILLAIIFPFKPSGSFFTTFNASILFYIFGFFLYYLKQVK